MDPNACFCYGFLAVAFFFFSSLTVLVKLLLLCKLDCLITYLVKTCVTTGKDNERKKKMDLDRNTNKGKKFCMHFLHYQVGHEDNAFTMEQ